jgi:hypothetical protein
LNAKDEEVMAMIDLGKSNGGRENNVWGKKFAGKNINPVDFLAALFFYLFQFLLT